VRARFLRLALAVSLLLGVLATPAAALQSTHELEYKIDGSGVARGSFDILFGVAIDNSGGPSDGDAYVSDGFFSEAETFEGRVYKFDEDGAFTGVEFDGADSPAGSFSLFSEGSFAFDGVVVDNSAGANAGSVYVADTGHKVIDRYDEDGKFICQITGTATPSAQECAGLAGSATPVGEIKPISLAVDESTGDLYVGDGAQGVIYEFNAAGEYLREVADPHITLPSDIDLDSTGAIYVSNTSVFSGVGPVVKLDPSGAFVAVVDEEEPIAVGVDPATDHVYVSKEGGISEYDSAGALVNEFATGGEESIFYLTFGVDSKTGRIYAPEFGFGGFVTVDVFSPETTVPRLTLGAATEASETTAVVRGEIDPDGGGDVGKCKFEYGLTTAYGQTAPCAEPLPITAPTAVSASLAGLAPSAVYHYRLRAANGGSAPYTKGLVRATQDGTFVTTGAPSIDEQSVTNIERFEADLRAKVNPHGFDTEYKFEYVDDQHFVAEGGFASPSTRSTPVSSIGDGLKSLSVGQRIANLAAGTTYHFRIVAVNSRGTVDGPDQTFATLPVAAIKRQWAYAQVKDALLEAEINPIGLASTCEAQYVDDGAFQQSGYQDATSQPCPAGLGSGTDPVTARANVDGLSIGTKYHFRFLVRNTSGTEVGEDDEFETFGITKFTYEVLDREGNPENQAGAYPYETVTHFEYSRSIVPTASGSVGALSAFLKDVSTELSPGRVGSAAVPDRCLGHVVEEERCSQDTQVGSITVEYFEGDSVSTRTRALYNVYAPFGVANRYASIDPYTASDASVRTESDYGTTATAGNITEEARIVGVTARIWGVPGDHGHDDIRRCLSGERPCESHAPLLPMLRNPTECGGPLTTKAKVDTWAAPGRYVEAKTVTPPVSGCDKLSFDPSIEVRPTTHAADSPTGLHFDLHVPQKEDPEELAVADLKNAKISLSGGLTINPAVGGGLVGCAPAEIELHGRAPAKCPDASKLGSAEIKTPLLDHPVHGEVYAAAPYDNPFDSLLGIYVAVDDPETGVTLKLAGKIEADAETGRLTTTFSDNPQLPFEDLVLDFFDGPRALLRTPAACGTYTTTATLTPWSAPASGPPAEVADSYAIDAGANGDRCIANESEAPSRPVFSAGSVRPRAGAYSPFVMKLLRDDGTQQVAGLTLTPPPGLVARLAGRASCGAAALAAAAAETGMQERSQPSCPDASKVGSVSITSGAGTSPFRVAGQAYLAGPYKGAPLSIAVIVPAVAGPFDLGTVVVRSAVHVAPNSAQVSIATDPVPAIVKGIKLGIRAIELDLNGDRFTLNPTSCAPTAVQGSLATLLGSPVSLQAPYRLGGCHGLRFKPKLGLRLLGGTHRGQHPVLRAVLRMPAGGANLKHVVVVVPPSEFLDNDHIEAICTRERFSGDDCPAGSAYGYAKAWSPLLDDPIGGPVYLRSSNNRLPDLVTDLEGRIGVTLDGHLGAAHGGTVASIDNIPDVPVSKFMLTMKGRGHGLLENAVDVCAHPPLARVEFEGHNGHFSKRWIPLRANC
jgi:hypothetical protein